MKTVRLGYSRLYNANGCSLLGADEVLLKFAVGAIDVQAYVGPNTHHIIASFKIGPPRPKDAQARGRLSRARGYELPSPDKFPADLYTELIATEAIEVDDTLAAAFHARDRAARDEMLRIAEKKQSSFTTALDYVAGVLGLRLHYFLVRTSISEQHFAYREKGAPYAFAASLPVKVIPTREWNISDKRLSSIPKLRSGWTWEKAAEVLAWLLRAWAAEDSVLEFISLFIPLERVVPKMPNSDRNSWEQKRRAILGIIEKKAAPEDRNDLSRFVSDPGQAPAQLALRFEKWASDSSLSGWERDVATFRRFNSMRNSLLHAGKPNVKLRVIVGADEVRTLEDIAARYVSLALFGDANVFQMRKAIPSKRS